MDAKRAPNDTDAVSTRRLTDDERQRALAVLQALDAFQKQMLAERGGEPFPSSVELIRQMRDERTEELMRRHRTAAPKHNP